MMSSLKTNDKNGNKLSVNQNINNNNNNIIISNCSQQLNQLSTNCQSIEVKELNELISCHLCKGYLIDATTVVECLHSFCKTCIINHLESNTPKSRFCPRCDLQIHKTKPKLNIRSDPTLQDIVYKLVPGLYKNEMNRRKEFYSKEPENAIGLSNEERGEMSGERLIFTPEDSICLSIEYFPQVISYSLLPFSKCLSNGALNCETSNDNNNNNQRRYLRCEGGMRVLHLKKWLKLKYDVKDDNIIEIMYKHDPLFDDYTMMDLAYIYSWRRNGPLCLYYKIIEPHKQKDESFFIAPQFVPKRRHTLKHRHKQNKKKKCVHESNLITTNPVNEPLPPVDSALINKVVASNTIGANIEFTSNNSNNIIMNTSKTNSSINNNSHNNNNNNNKIQSQTINNSVPKLAKKNDIINSVKSLTNNNRIEINGLKKKTIVNDKNNIINNNVNKNKQNTDNHNNESNHNLNKNNSITITAINNETNGKSSNNVVTNGSNGSQSKSNSNHMNNKTIDNNIKKVSNTNTNSSKTAVNTDNSNHDLKDKNNGFNNEKSIKLVKDNKNITSKSMHSMPPLIPLPAPDFLYSSFASKIMPKTPIDINSDLEVALNLSTSSKSKTT